MIKRRAHVTFSQSEAKCPLLGFPLSGEGRCMMKMSQRKIKVKICTFYQTGNDFYKTNHSKIHDIRPITPKSDWSYNHPPLYRERVIFSGFVRLCYFLLAQNYEIFDKTSARTWSLIIEVRGGNLDLAHFRVTGRDTLLTWFIDPRSYQNVVLSLYYLNNIVKF